VLGIGKGVIGFGVGNNSGASKPRDKDPVWQGASHLNVIQAVRPSIMGTIKAIA